MKSKFLLNKNCFRPISAKRDSCPQILILLMNLLFFKRVYTKKVEFLTTAKKVTIFLKWVLKCRFFVKILRILKGGSWASQHHLATIRYRNVVDGDIKNPTFGFRCAKPVG